MTIVIFGDRKTIEPSIRALNLGSVKDVSIDEVFCAGTVTMGVLRGLSFPIPMIARPRR